MEKFEIKVIKGKEKLSTTDWVTEEIPLTIYLNSKELVTLQASPFDLEELVIGFLFTSGFIKEKSEIKNITIDPERWRAGVELDGQNSAENLAFKRLYTSGCGKGVIYYNPIDMLQRTKLTSGFYISSDRIITLMKEFQKKSEEFKSTGGVHSAGLCDQEKIIIFKDDIGRHNAIDKVIGSAISKGLSFADKIFLTSGRLSSEILLKVNKCRSPVIASSSAPTNQAVKLARELNTTLIGFVRGGRMNIYSGEERIV